MIVLLIILIILILQVIINQQELDYHIIEQNKDNKVFSVSNDGIMYRGIINRLIWFLRTLYHNTLGE